MSQTPILDSINCPGDLKALGEEELKLLASECRQVIIKTVSENGGHLASNLGVVELILCLAHCFDFTENGDRLIFDVGHQSYTWKLITGRKDRFHTLRRQGGISGFPKREESPYDVYNTGHSSTAISAALGMARADRLKGVRRRHIALVGDGALTGGMSFEALNDAGASGEPILVIVNDNMMSIDENVGGLSLHLERLRVSRGYRRMKKQVKSHLSEKEGVSEKILSMLRRASARMRTYRRSSGILFEELGFRYYGPVDGQDIHSLIEHLETVGERDVPVVLHVLTRKGQGYSFAEETPTHFHGVAPFVIETGESAHPSQRKSFTSLVGEELSRLAAEDPRICAITAAMREGCGLCDFAARYPDRFFDVGIAEQHASGMAAGLASCGMKPFLSLYSTFAQRAVDQILHDICLQNLPVTLLLDHSGFVSSDGETHQGIYDQALLQGLPNLELLSPADGEDVKACLSYAAEADHPLVIRYPKDALPDPLPLAIPREIHKPRLLCEGDRLVLAALGSLSSEALRAAEILRRDLFEITVFSCTNGKAGDLCDMIEMCKKTARLVIAEDGISPSGFASLLLSEISQKIPFPQVCLCGIKDPLRGQASRQELLHAEGLDAVGLAAQIRKWSLEQDKIRY